MAESGTANSWWGWLLDAKDKVVTQSSEVVEFVKKDISEFAKVVGDEASSAVSSTASALKEKLKLDEEDSAASHVKKSLSGFLNHVSEVLTPPPDDDDEEAILIQNHEPVPLNRSEAAVYSLSQDQTTFLRNPETEQAQFGAWLEKFELDKHHAELSQLLVDNAALRQNYTLLVPAQVSHAVFWHRYLYKLERLKEAENTRQQLKDKAEQVDVQKDLPWDEDEEFDAVDIPEHVQMQLLEEYQKECEEQKRLSKVSKASIASTTAPTSNEQDYKVSGNSDNSNDEEWEKVDPPQCESKPSDPARQTATDPKGEDWENWE